MSIRKLPISPLAENFFFQIVSVRVIATRSFRARRPSGEVSAFTLRRGPRVRTRLGFPPEVVGTGMRQRLCRHAFPVTRCCQHKGGASRQRRYFRVNTKLMEAAAEDTCVFVPEGGNT